MRALEWHGERVLLGYVPGRAADGPADPPARPGRSTRGGQGNGCDCAGAAGCGGRRATSRQSGHVERVSPPGQHPRVPRSVPHRPPPTVSAPPRTAAGRSARVIGPELVCW
ncbi:hypothetical protein GZL_07781 [Streptomyces sp. 769]|nr:hypothetical protein GZL_07781 [Streptomyces sp. 769]